MILIDQNEPEIFDYYLSQSTEVNRGNYNKSPGASLSLTYPDFTIINGGKTVGINRKQSTEWLAGIDSWENQLLMELQGPIDYLISIIEGSIIPDGDGVIGISYQEAGVTWRRNGHSCVVDAQGERSQWNYKAIQGKIQAMWEVGIPTYFTSNILGSAIFIAEMHHRATEGYVSKTLGRLIKEKYQITETEKLMRDWILFLMGIPGIGEDKAVKLANTYTSICDLINRIDTVRSLPGFGPGVERNMRSFLGL